MIIWHRVMGKTISHICILHGGLWLAADMTFHNIRIDLWVFPKHTDRRQTVLYKTPGVLILVPRFHLTR